MSASSLSEVLVAVVAVLGVFGGVFQFVDRRLSALRVQVTSALATVAAKDETIRELQRQVDRLSVTAEIQAKFFNELPRAKSGGSGSE